MRTPDPELNTRGDVASKFDLNDWLTATVLYSTAFSRHTVSYCTCTVLYCTVPLESVFKMHATTVSVFCAPGDLDPSAYPTDLSPRPSAIHISN